MFNFIKKQTRPYKVVLVVICFVFAFSNINNNNTVIVTISLPKVGPSSFQNLVATIDVNSPNPELVLLFSVLDVLAVRNGQLHFCNMNKSIIIKLSYSSLFFILSFTSPCATITTLSFHPLNGEIDIE